MNVLLYNKNKHTFIEHAQCGVLLLLKGRG